MNSIRRDLLIVTGIVVDDATVVVLLEWWFV